eukprot:scaffold18930_cov140-Isochrysis_galbana.AAC.1
MTGPFQQENACSRRVDAEAGRLQEARLHSLPIDNNPSFRSGSEREIGLDAHREWGAASTRTLCKQAR